MPFNPAFLAFILLKHKVKEIFIMLTVSLVFSLVMLVSFDSLSAALIATSAWATLSFMIFSGSVI